MKKILGLAGLFILFTLSIIFFTHIASAPESQNPLDIANRSTENANGFDKKQHPLDKPGSIWWIVSKTHPVSPIDYAPTDLVVPNIPLRARSGDSEMRLRSEAANAIEQLVTAGKQQKLYFVLASGYRSYQLEVANYYANFQKFGQAGADKLSRRPGTSENQSGLAADLTSIPVECEIELCFADTPEGKWLAANAYKYGFIIRYPEGKTAITGYEYEPWHVRYVGSSLSIEMHRQNILTLEEFFNIPAAASP